MAKTDNLMSHLITDKYKLGHERKNEPRTPRILWVHTEEATKLQEATRNLQKYRIQFLTTLKLITNAADLFPENTLRISIVINRLPM